MKILLDVVASPMIFIPIAAVAVVLIVVSVGVVLILTAANKNNKK